MSRAPLLAVLLAACPASASLPLASLAIQDSDSEGAADRLRGLAEELGGKEATRETDHGVKPIRHGVLLLPAARYAEFEKEVRRRWPRAALEREDAAAAGPAGARASLAAAVDELGDFEGQLPVLAGFLQLRLEEQGAAESDWLRVVCAVVEDRVDPQDLPIYAKGSGLRRFEVSAPAAAAPLSPRAVASAKELRALLDGGRPRSSHALRQRLRALDAEAKDFPLFLKERPALSAVLADARRDLRARLAAPAAAVKAP
ncbi:MAG: hypothetical protein SF051_05485 [Elusimicrobiota bacterium]|nr:hypothetical protein [Elusimicrobiota bacterium]